MTRTESREKQNRSAQERKKSWTPPNKLDAPEPREGMKHRYVRTQVQGKDDTMNVVSRLRQHYEPVKAEEHPDFIAPTLEDGQFQGTVQVGDLMLMEVPEHIANQRNDYFQKQADALMGKVESDLDDAENEQYGMRVVERTFDRDVEYGDRDKEVIFQEDEGIK